MKGKERERKRHHNVCTWFYANFKFAHKKILNGSGKSLNKNAAKKFLYLAGVVNQIFFLRLSRFNKVENKTPKGLYVMQLPY